MSMNEARLSSGQPIKIVIQIAEYNVHLPRNLHES